MGTLSNYSKLELADHVFNAAYPPLSNVYLTLCTGDPTPAGTGASMSEHPDSLGYSRKEISFGLAGATTARRVIQDAIVSFDQATGAWQPITHWALVDSDTHGDGNMLASGAFDNSFSPVAGNTPTIASGQVYVSIQASSGEGITNYTVHKLLDLMFNGVTFTSPSGSTYVAFATAVIADDDVLYTDLTEVSAGGYARELVDVNGGTSPTWSVAAITGIIGKVANLGLVEMGPPSASWGLVVSAAILDHLTTGNVLFYDNDQIVDQTPESGDPVQFGVGDLVASLQ